MLSCLTLLWLGCPGNRQGAGQGPDSRPGTQPRQTTPALPMQTPTFNGQRAFSYLTQQTSFGPRNPNSQGHDACLNFLLETLRSTADRVDRQDFTRTGYRGEVLRMSNIIASFNPAAEARIVLCAHWDTRPRADRDPDKNRRNEPMLGANDGASGVAVLLEIAGLLKSNPPPVGVDIVLFDGEDYGREGDQAYYLLGSRYYAQHLPEGYIPRFGVLLDMVGDKQLEIPKEINSTRFAPDVVETIWTIARQLGVQQFVDAPGEEVMDDHWPLNEAGIKTVDLIDFNYPDRTNRFWHTHQDVPENCSAESLEAVGTVITHLVYSQTP